MATRSEVTTEEFISSLAGNITRGVTDGHDVFLEYSDGRVVMFTSYMGKIVLCQMEVMPHTLQ